MSSTFKMTIPFLTNFEGSLPLASYGLSWLLPSLAVIFAVEPVSKLFQYKKSRLEAKNYV